MKKTLFIGLWVIASGLLLGACVPLWDATPAQPAVPGREWRGGDFSSNGERIYFTATNTRGESIRYTGGPATGGGMMGASLACVSCHGADGRGGSHTMHMEVMDAPDIRYKTLAGEAHGEDGGAADEGHDADPAYNLETFRLAVVEGKHPNGDSLDRDMPRWNLSDEDLEDLLDYLKTLP